MPVPYDAAREGMSAMTSRDCVCAFLASARIRTVAAAPTAGATTLRTVEIVELMSSAASKHLLRSTAGGQYKGGKVSEQYELARGGCGAGRQRTIAAGHAEVVGTVLVAELA